MYSHGQQTIHIATVFCFAAATAVAFAAFLSFIATIEWPPTVKVATKMRMNQLPLIRECGLICSVHRRCCGSLKRWGISSERRRERHPVKKWIRSRLALGPAYLADSQRTSGHHARPVILEELWYCSRIASGGFDHDGHSRSQLGPNSQHLSLWCQS